MIAALPWYPAAQSTLDLLWRLARARLGYGPEALSWTASGDMPLLTQTCAPVWDRRYRGRLHPLGALDFGVAPRGLYASVLVTRIEEGRTLDTCAPRVAVNDFESQSGWGALRGLPIREVAETGGHAASMACVASGGADLAAIDAVTWRLAPHPRLAVRATTPPTPAPPLLTAFPDRAQALRDALAHAVRALPLAHRRRTGLRAFVPLTDAHYDGLAPLPPRPRCNRAGIAA